MFCSPLTTAHTFLSPSPLPERIAHPQPHTHTHAHTHAQANTPGCTTQGQCFRDAYAEYASAGYTVYGLSNDNPAPLANWKSKQGFQYDLLSDPERTLIGALTGNKSKTDRR